MKRRIFAIVLVLLMVLSLFTGCKSDSADDLVFDVQSGVQQEQNEVNQPSENQPSQNQGEQNSATSNQPAGNSNQSQGQSNIPNNDNAQSGKPSGDQGGSSKPQSDQSANQNSSSEGANQNVSSEGLKETFNGEKPINVSAGETVWFGPVSTAQAEQGTFADAAGKTAKIVESSLQKVATFGNGYVIYSYKAPAAGSVTLQSPELYKASFIASKDAMDLNAFYGYWDNVQGRNLYDAGLDKSSKWIGIDGKAKDSDQGGQTHAIPVKKGETLTFAPVSSATLVQGCGYDADMKPVDIFSGYDLKEAFAFPQGMRAYTYTVPDGVSYVRINVPAAVRETFMVMKNKEFDSKYYCRVFNIVAEAVEDPLYQKNCLFVGDSICAAGHDSADDAGLRGWARRVKELSGAYCTNEGVSGAALSDCRMSRPNATEYHIIHKQLSKNSGSDFDYVLIHGGTNDAWDSVPIGSVTKEYDPTFFDLSTYAGGLEYAIYTAITEYGDTAAFGYLMNFQMPRNTAGVVATQLGDYFEVGKQICEKWNISYFDMFNHQEINKKMDPTSSTHLPDGTHPDDSGYDILGPYITEYMRSMTPVTQTIRDELAAIG